MNSIISNLPETVTKKCFNSPAWMEKVLLIAVSNLVFVFKFTYNGKRSVDASLVTLKKSLPDYPITKFE